MAAISKQDLVARAAGSVAKRENWASSNVGPMVVFCIVGAVALLLIGLWTYNFFKRRRASKPVII